MDPFSNHIHAASGYLDLGILLEANEEIESIEPEMEDAFRDAYRRVKIFRALGKWDLIPLMAA